jgi:2-(1,2-epoxy-1,2-dihydrophenyl)acetyl-CoA isomerase
VRTAVGDAQADRSVRCLVLTGAGKGFCAGADVREWEEAARDGTPEDPDDGWVAHAHGLIRELAGFDRPTVALLNGAAVGAGLDLALACDFRVAADDARFACAYTWIAYNPDAGGTWLLPRLVGIEAAKRFVYTGEFWDAQTALARGLVSEVHARDALEEGATALARLLASGPTIAQGEAKRLLDTAHTRDLAAQLVAEQLAGERCAQTEDHREALRAATDRRAPTFQGR